MIVGLFRADSAGGLPVNKGAEGADTAKDFGIRVPPLGKSRLFIMLSDVCASCAVVAGGSYH